MVGAFVLSWAPILATVALLVVAFTARPRPRPLRVTRRRESRR